MKHVLIVCMAVAAVAFLLPGQVSAQNVIGTAHDISSNGCLSCHAVHNGVGSAPSWGQTLTTETFTPYVSGATTDHTPAAPTAGSVSLLCLSCHDGVTTIDADSSIMSGNAAIGTDLSTSHPVSFTYDAALATADGGLVTPTDATTVDGTLPLFAGMLECATCHNPHDDSNSPFLRVDNTASALCQDCHNK